MNKRTLHVFAAAALSAAFLCAQTGATPPTPPTPAEMVTHRVDRLTALLTLTATQQTQATTIYSNLQAALSTVMASMTTARTALHTDVTTNNVGGIAAAATQIGTLTAQQVEAQGKADGAFYAILTPDQQTKYTQLGGHGFRGPGPGGFGGPGGPHGPGGPRGPRP
ncbi:MAG: Spy/CpxP family protein refolding chaperone [Acidobacteriota bacterium]|nr:Spy/CpxP family protein refolding chaperone [Acidobacteriota bacterium]